MSNSKAEKPRGEETRQNASRRNNPEVCARSNNPRCKKSSTKKDSREMKLRHNTYEIDECSGSKDDLKRVIEEESEVEKTEDLEKVFEHEILKNMKRKPKGKEKKYREKVISGCRARKARRKKDANDNLQTALTVAEKKKTKL